MVGLLGQGISPTQGRCIAQHEHRIKRRQYVRAQGGIQTHDLSVSGGGGISWLRHRSYCFRCYQLHILY
jgi:hypothetical protein